MFSKILIANRGEIALRIIRACRELEIQTAVVYSTADKHAAYLKLADQAICIGDAPPAESYLNIPRIISAAEIADVQAIHPGYGFLAENAHFAEICRSCKIEFIGPPVEAMAALGDKVACKKLAKKAKVPTVPGSDGAVEDEKVALENRAGNWLSRHHQGSGRGRRTRNAGRAQRRLPPRRLEAGAGRGGKCVQGLHCLHRKICRIRAARRSADPCRHAWERRAPLGARLLHAATPPEAC